MTYTLPTKIHQNYALSLSLSAFLTKILQVTEKHVADIEKYGER